MTIVAEDRLPLVGTSQAAGMSLAHMLLQLSIPKTLELRQAQQEENLPVLLKEGRNHQHRRAVHILPRATWQ